MTSGRACLILAASLPAPFGFPFTSDGACSLGAHSTLHTGEEYSYSADVWGLGLTLVTCALGRFPFDHTGGYWGLVSALREMDPPELPANQVRWE